MTSNGNISDLKVRKKGKIVKLLTCFIKPLEDLEYSTSHTDYSYGTFYVRHGLYELSLHGKQFLKIIFLNQCSTKITNV